MRIDSLIVKGLHGVYDYNVEFNSDITLLYGINGCGKTTILNIVGYIITGELYKLYNYNFKLIELRYRRDNKMLYESVQIERDNDSHLSVVLFYRDKKPIKYIVSRNVYESRDYMYEFERFESDRVFNDIKKLFSHIYLTVDRANKFKSDISGMDLTPPEHRYLRNQMLEKGSYDSVGLMQEKEIIHIKRMVMEQVMSDHSDIRALNNKFKSDFVKLLINIKTMNDWSDIIKRLQRSSTKIDNEVNDLRKSYLNVISKLGINEDILVTEYRNKFESNLNQICDLLKNKENEISDELLLLYSEVDKVRQLAELVNNTDAEESKIKKPLNTLKSIMNQFFGLAMNTKVLEIDDMGRIYFYDKQKPDRVDISMLSSGEKQLLIFFTNLILGLKSDDSGIFIIDEPELSLHLAWQNIFIDKILEVGKDVQLIFATHAPEIVAHHRNKLVELKREYPKDGKA